MRSGTGTYIFANGNKYVGEWHDDKRQGVGVNCYKLEECQYIGSYEDDHRHGPGVLVHQDHKYHGMWRDDLPNGKGHYVFDNGLVQEGAYEVTSGRQLPTDDQSVHSSEDLSATPQPVWRPTRVLCAQEARAKIDELEKRIAAVKSHTSVGSADIVPTDLKVPPASEDEEKATEDDDETKESQQEEEAENAEETRSVEKTENIKNPIILKK